MSYTAFELDALGFTINLPKSVLGDQIAQVIKHLGFILDSVNMTVKLTPKKIKGIEILAENLLSCKKVTIRMVMKFIGKLVATEPGFTHAPLYYKEIENYKNNMITYMRGDFDAVIEIPQHITKQILWWKDNIQHVCRHVVIPAPSYQLQTDSSNTGWGGVGCDGFRANGHWSVIEQDYHINVTELLGIYYMLLSLYKDKHDCHIQILSDNTTAVACLNKMASTKQLLMKYTRKIWLWAIQRSIILSAKYLPGIDNEIADYESRKVEKLDSEWMLRKDIFNDLCGLFGTPDIDMFATRLNCQIDKYVAWKPDPFAHGIDAFHQQWTDKLIYAFPPFSMIPKIIQLILHRRGAINTSSRIMMIVPKWTTQAWWVPLLEMTIDYPIILPRNSLVMPQHPRMEHRLKISLVCMIISPDRSTVRTFQDGLPRSYTPRGRVPLPNSTGRISIDGMTFVVNDKLITFRHL